MYSEAVRASIKFICKVFFIVMDITIQHDMTEIIKKNYIRT